MDHQITGFALGLLLGAAKVGLVGTVGFGIGWWRARRRIKELEAMPRLEDRLTNLERTLDDTSNQLAELIEGQATLSRQLMALPGMPKPHDPP